MKHLLLPNWHGNPPRLVDGLKDRLRPRFKSNACIGEMRAQLPELADDLVAACKGVEPEFMKIGQELHAIYEDVRGLTRHVLYSVTIISGKDNEGVLFQLRGIAEQSLADLEGCQKDVSKKTDLIKTVMGHLGVLSNVFPLVEKVGQFLWVVAVNIGIKSARSIESAALFSVVARETREFSYKLRATSEGGLDVVRKSLDSHRSLFKDLSEGLKKINRMGESARKIVRGAVQEIENLMASTLQVMGKAGEHSRRISQQVGNLVMAVQFHDSMSQRVEHIAMALCEVEQLLAGKASDKFAQALSIMKLQSAQLKEIIDEIGRVYELGVCSFDEIIREFSTLLERLSELNASSGNNLGPLGVVGDPFEKLRSSFGDLNGIMHQGLALNDSLRHASCQASETAAHVSGLVQNIRTIGFESHLMALNAIVKAAHLGSEGGAFEVLAQEAKNASDQSKSIMERADKLLGLVMDSAEKLRDQKTNREADVSPDDSLSDITPAYNRFIEARRVARERADEITHTISKTKASLDFLPLFAEKLAESLEHFKVMSRDLNSFVPGKHRLRQEEVDQIVECYNMEKEREILEAALYSSSDRNEKRYILGDLPDADEKPEKAEDAATEEGLNKIIELFADGSETEANPIDQIDLFTGNAAKPRDELSGKTEELESGVILFDRFGPEAKKEEAQNASESERTREHVEDLGGNVELF